MGREIRRVPVDFDWPYNKIWTGFINPHFKPCPENNRSCINGVTPARAWVGAITRLLLTASKDASDFKHDVPKRNGRIWPHPYLAELMTAPHTDGEFDKEAKKWITPPRIIPPTGQDLIDFGAGLTGRSPEDSPIGYDGSAQYRAERTIIAAAKLDPKTWGICPVCEGHCIDPEVREVCESWEREPPPKGEGWQVWETVSEGSPVSPVFPTAEELIDWLCQPYASDPQWRKSAGFRPGWVPEGQHGPWGRQFYSEQGKTRKVAERFVLGPGWVPSAMGETRTDADGKKQTLLVAGMDSVLLLEEKADGDA